MRRTNKTPRPGVCTTYVGHRCLPSLPKEWGHKVPSCSDLRSPGKISRLGEPLHSRWEFSQKRREREKTTWWKPVFPGTDPISLFSRSTFILLVVHRDKCKRVSQGQLLDPYLKTVFSAYLCSYKGLTFALQYLLVWRPINILWPHLSFY